MKLKKLLTAAGALLGLLVMAALVMGQVAPQKISWAYKLWLPDHTAVVLEVDASGHLRPAADNLYNLGSGSYRFQEIYGTTFYGAVAPTGLTASCEQERFQEQNRVLALELLRAKLWEAEELRKESTMAGYRSAIGRGMRSEKIRTYNFAQDRVTDHRIKKSWHNLEGILDGKLDKVIGSGVD